MSCRFWSKVKLAKGDKCWVWLGSRLSGYGSFHMNGRPQLAHRVSWELMRDAIPGGLYVLHRCDNRRCVNPKHLFLGTQADNVADMMTKGNWGNAPRPDSSWQKERSRLRLPGGRGTAKLTTKQVVEIRERYARGGICQAALAEVFEVSKPAISQITTGATWKKVGGPRTQHWKRRG